VQQGDLVTIAPASKYISAKYKNITWRKYPVLSQNVFTGEILDTTLNNKSINYKRWASVYREKYNDFVVLFNPRIQDLKLFERVNKETILFSIKGMSY